MSQIIAGWNWFLSQNLLTQALVSIGALNIIIAGLKQLGLTTLADFCQKLENCESVDHEIVQSKTRCQID